MGFLSGEITIVNRTAYLWSVCVETQNIWLFGNRYDTDKVEPYERTKQHQTILTTWGKTIYIKVKYGEHPETECCENPDLWYIFDPRYDPCFTIQETEDHREIHLDCSIEYKKKKSTCPNYGKLEDDARLLDENERRRIEEQRRQAQLELERRIEEQLKRENELAVKKLSQATEKLKQIQRLRVHDVHLQTQLMQQPLEINASHTDEIAEAEQKFTELLLEHEIAEDEDSEETELSERIKTLQNELMVEFCKKHKLTSSCLFSLDAALGYESLPLRDRLSVLEAVLGLVLSESEDDQTLKYDRNVVLELLKKLQDDHPSLAFKLLQNILYSDMQLSMQSKEILGQILFNNVWTPEEITQFMVKITGKDKELVGSVLHMSQTYKLQFCTVTSAMDSPEPLRVLQRGINQERSKDTKAIISDMRHANYPKNILTILEDVLLYLEDMLPIYETADLSKNYIQDIKKMVQGLDFSNPDTEVLRNVLVALSVAVKLSSAKTIQKGKTETDIVGYVPRLNQLATLVMFLLPKSKANSGCLLEIGTGEGKSCVLAMLATIHAIRGVKVDVVTSSPVLARRDLEEWKKLYDMFGVTSSVVPPPLNGSSPEEQDKLVQEAYTHQVIYGTVGTFAADTLKQEFEKETTRGERGFELVLVDEVDYMTLDNGVQITFLSQESSGLQHLEQVLAGIWAIISSCRPIEVSEIGEIMWTTRIQNFHMAALVAMIGSEPNDKFSPLEILLPGVELGFYSEQDFKNLDNTMNADEPQQQQAWETIMAKTGVEQQYDLLSVLEMGMEHKVAFNCYEYQSETRKVIQFGDKKTKTDQNINMLLLEKGKACEILSEGLLVEATVAQMKSKIRYSGKCVSDPKEGSLVIPSFLEKYLENQLPVFVENAFRAIQMTKGREYMIERSLSSQGLDISDDDEYMYHSVIPVDFQASGMLEKRKRWGDGLQQFLEMKHQLALSPLSNVTNYMSNSSFFKRYIRGKGIFGVSGTLGSTADKDFLARHYKTDSYVIPAHQREKVTELPAVQVRGGTDQWILKICVTVSKVSARGQVVLVVCEDLNTANMIKEKISSNTKHPVTMYTMSESHNIENQEFNKGQIIITTNLGGRGTDIKVAEEVNRRGGLFVILTYFPSNRRVEKQVSGRTGRKGTPGMVQLILNHDRLPTAYQGHPIEIMRELREEHEANRIKDMEKEKLAEIEMKEELFSMFCHFLSDFDKHYSKEEKTDLSEVKAKDVPPYFESVHSKMDYHPALNALKESWAMWLTLQTNQIKVQNDITELKINLLEHLQDTSDQLLRGQSANMYDHIEQALGRTALHFQNKTKHDYGAQSYWQRVRDSDEYYRAVALYNQAYVTINMAEKDYKVKARTLLEEAEKAIDVYILETTNTLSFCSMSVSRDFEPHHGESCNFQTQMQGRLNIFNSWKNNIAQILNKLKEDKDDFKTVDLTLYSLSAKQDFVSTSELNLFRNYGLTLVFEVEKKPKFSFDALLCCFIGVVQVVAGVLIRTYLNGFLSSFGNALISNGVPDVITGVMGMLNGDFTWTSSLISQSMKTGFSLISGGCSSGKMPPSVNKAASEILNGTVSLACNFLQSKGKSLTSSCTGKSTKAMAPLTIRNITANTAKLNLKKASMHAVYQLAVQGVNTAVNNMDSTIQNTFRRGFQQTFKNSICAALQENKQFVRTLTDFISSGIPKTALEKARGSYKIGKDLKKEIKHHVDMQSELIVNDLITNCKEVHQTISTLSRVWDIAAEHVAKKTNTCIKTLLSAAGIYTNIYQTYSSIPTKKTMDTKFVPAFVKSMGENLLYGVYNNDGRDKLDDVQCLKDDLIDSISDGLSQAIVDRFAGVATSMFTRTFSNKLNSASGKIVGNMLQGDQTPRLPVTPKHKYQKSPDERKKKSLSEAELNNLTSYADTIAQEKRLATALDLHILTKSDLLEGKGICVTVVDDKGKLLSEETHPGTNPTSGNINLLLTKNPLISLGKPAQKVDEDVLLGCQIYIIRPDGSREAVNSSDQNCLFNAIVQAMSRDYISHQKATELKRKFSQEVLSKPHKYADALKIQNMFNGTNGASRFKIQAGLSEYEKELHAKYIKGKTPKQITDDYKLGKVGEYKCLSDMKKPTPGVVEAVYIPPQRTWHDVFNLIKMKEDVASSLEKKNSEAYKLMEKIMNDPVKGNQLCMNILYSDHRQAISNSKSAVSKACRNYLTNTLASGNTEKALKLSLMMIHPECSNNICNDLGIPHNVQSSDSGLPVMDRNQYYKTGFMEIVKKYSMWNLINTRQTYRLLRWVKEDTFLDTSTSEYKEIINVIKAARNPSSGTQT